MSAWGGWLTRLRRGLRRDRFEAEMADELRTHLEMEAAARQARGASPEAARREAAMAFGHVESLRRPSGTGGPGSGWRRPRRT